MHYEFKPKVHIKGTSTEEGKVLVQCSNPLIIHMANFEHVAIFVKDSMARKRSEKERWNILIMEFGFILNYMHALTHPNSHVTFSSLLVKYYKIQS